MYLTATADFGTVDWTDPADAERDWWLDRTHCPVALPPLPAEMFGAWIEAGLHARLIAVNGYVFMGGDAEPRPRDFDVPAVQAWDQQAAVLVEQPCLAIRTRRYDDRDPVAALDALESAIRESAAAFAFTMDIAGAIFPLLGRFVDVCTSIAGRTGPLEAATISGDGKSITLESAAALEQLATLADASPVVANLVRAGDVTALRGEPEAGAFIRGFDALIERFGWRCQEWTDLHRPTWADEPHIPLAMVARYLDAPGQRPSAAFARASEARAEAVARVEAAISEPSVLADFRECLASVEGAQRVIEERSHWQMQLFAALREPAMALGRALAAEGLIESPGDVLFLSRAELAPLSRGARAEGRRAVAGRRAQLVQWEQLHPPISIGRRGARYSVPPEWGSADRKGVAALQNEGARVVRGVGVSRGVATGRARVAATLEDAERVIERGDILVCRTTSPPWTPLFATVAGIVTDAGGMLSHAAITAREYGIPAITNTGSGTREIPDGATITIDGAAGTVIIDG